MKKKLSLITLCIIVLIGTGWFYFKSKHEAEILAFEKQTLLGQILHHKEVGVIHSEINDTQDVWFAVYYPQFDVDEIDQQLFQFIQGRIDSFKEDHQALTEAGKPVLNIDYNSYKVNERFVSIFFQEQITSPLYANPPQNNYSFLLDLENHKIIDKSEFFKEGYLDTLSQIAQKKLEKEYPNLFLEGISPKQENFDNIVFQNEGLIIVFDKYQVLPGYLGLIELPIHYDDINAILKYDPVKNVVIKEKQEPVKVEVKKQEEPVAENLKMVAFTFDDGPYTPVTNRLLDAFQNVNGHGTFFVVGNRISTYPEAIKRIALEGHQIGNHTYNHPSLPSLSPNQMLQQINLTNEEINKVVQMEVTVVRPTFGQTDTTVESTIAYPMINWTVDSQDWKSRDREAIVNTVMSNIHDNAIVLFHDLYPSTADAIDYLIPKLTEMGYTFVTLDEMASQLGVTLQPHQVYWGIK